MSGLEVGDEGPDRRLVGLRSPGSEGRERIRDRAWDSLGTFKRFRARRGVAILSEHEERERGRVAPDRALGFRRPCFERPLRVVPRPYEVAGDEA